MVDRLDSVDEGEEISEVGARSPKKSCVNRNSYPPRLPETMPVNRTLQAEMRAYLKGLMSSPVAVAQWISHGVGLPRYAPAFLDNSISSLDFPLLIAHNGLHLR